MLDFDRLPLTTIQRDMHIAICRAIQSIDGATTRDMLLVLAQQMMYWQGTINAQKLDHAPTP